MRNFMTQLTTLAFVAVFAMGCGTGQRHAETEAAKQSGYFVDHESANGRTGVGNYADRISWGEMKRETVAAAAPVAAPAQKMDAATTAKVNKLLDSINTNLYFPVGGSQLNAKQKAGMKNLADVLKNYQSSTIYITGYTDSTGNPEKNKILSEKRAKSVTDELVKNGLQSDNVQTKGAGQDADAGTGQAKASARRVSLSVE